VTKDDDRYINGAKNSKLMRLLEQTSFSFQECAKTDKSSDQL
jgi:hypothetical protein